jgi:hypothetical protein
MNMLALPKLPEYIDRVFIPLKFLVFSLAFISVPVFGQQQSNDATLPQQYQLLRDELAVMFREDQDTRINSMQTLKKHGISISNTTKLEDPNLKEILDRETKKMKNVDEKNRTRLKQIIDEHGWLRKSQVGQHGAMVMWIIAQHADEEVQFQKQCLKFMQAATDGEIELKHIAYLTDRVLVNENKPQRYGTQMDNNFQPRPLEDPDNVDCRRAEVGLPTLSEYLSVAKQQYEKMAAGEAKSGGASK